VRDALKRTRCTPRLTEVQLGPGDTFAVDPRRPHLVTNGGDRSATFLTLQGVGEYDFVPL
jgi:mannose-6-phosphate isomerase-like protein (cupin superfamily)